MPAITSTCEFIFVTCLEPGIVGRITATATALHSLAGATAVVSAGPLVEHIAQPLLDGVLRDSLVYRMLSITSDSHRNAIALVWMIVGVVQCSFAVMFFGSKTLKRLEKSAVGRSIKSE